MCRFALVKNLIPEKPQEILNSFSDMAKASRAPDGDIQGDGWGVTWRPNNAWERHSSVKPIWESRIEFSSPPETNLFLIHARSASFSKDKDNIAYNQPYTNEKYAFVFNGLLKGMRYPRPLAGDIGAQKIWTLLQEFLDQSSTEVAIEKTVAELNKYAREVQALNLGLSDGEKLYAYCQFTDNANYYTLHAGQSLEKIIVSSEPLRGKTFSPLKANKLHVFG